MALPSAMMLRAKDGEHGATLTLDDSVGYPIESDATFWFIPVEKDNNNDNDNNKTKAHHSYQGSSDVSYPRVEGGEGTKSSLADAKAALRKQIDSQVSSLRERELRS